MSGHIHHDSLHLLLHAMSHRHLYEGDHFTAIHRLLQVSVILDIASHVISHIRSFLLPSRPVPTL